MRAGFVAGVVMALMDKGLMEFDQALAVSASVPTLACSAVGERGALERVWREELNTPKLVCYRNIPAVSLGFLSKRPVLDIDYLVQEVFKKKYPIDQEKLLQCGMKCLFAVTSAMDGRQLFLRPGEYDIYDLFKACIAVPGCYPESVCLGAEQYVDGGASNPLPLRMLMESRPEKVVAVLTRPSWSAFEPPTLLERALFWRYFQRYDWMMERLWEAAEAYREELTLLYELASQDPPQAMVICPDDVLPARFLTRDRRKINRTIDLGYSKAEALAPRIRRFLRGNGLRPA